MNPTTLLSSRLTRAIVLTCAGGLADCGGATGAAVAPGFVPWRAETCEPIFRRQHHGPRPVAPRLTKRILDTAIVSLR